MFRRIRKEGERASAAHVEVSRWRQTLVTKSDEPGRTQEQKRSQFLKR